MADEANITRRSVLRGLPLAGVAAAIPAVASNLPEMDTDRVNRLAAELSDAVEQAYGGSFAVVIKSGGDISYQWA
ncbi:MAG TPA: hypothetical protein VFT69_17100 [Pseudolabrys sp.]|nr:hypothetical protein [Pseudolabrys sp.]